MTDLTEQMKKGELPEGYYYLKLNPDFEDRYCVAYNYGIDFDLFAKGFDIDEVLAPVPSYEEWKASEKYNKHLEEVIKVYERKDKQATETSIAYNELTEENANLKSKLQLKETAYDFDTARLEEENVKLKELLKECRKSFNKLKGDTVWYPYEVDECIAKIDEALK